MKAIPIAQANKQLRAAGLTTREIRTNARRGSPTVLRVTNGTGQSFALPIAQDRMVDGNLVAALVA